jgi:hypothetical protein
MAAHMVLMDRSPQIDLTGISEPLDLRNIDPKAFARILKECSSPSLRLYHLTITKMDGIERLQTVSDLSLEWATKIVSISPIFDMLPLRNLEVIDFSRLAHFEGIAKLRNLVSFRASGGVWNQLRVSSVRPLVGLRSLKSLTLQNIRIADDDITVLAELPQLTHLLLSNQFDRAQFAFLAKRLNSRLNRPITAYVETKIPCKKCGHSVFMFTGRRMPLLCKECDAARFSKLTRAFQDHVDAA